MTLYLLIFQFMTNRFVRKVHPSHVHISHKFQEANLRLLIINSAILENNSSTYRIKVKVK